MVDIRRGQKREALRIFLREVFPIWIVRLLTNWWPDHIYCQRLRGWLFRPFFGLCGPGLRLNSNVTFLYPSCIRIGRDVLIGKGDWIDGSGGINIEDEVLLSPYCVITSSSHTFRDNSASRGKDRHAPTRVGRGSWLGAHVTVTAGVSIGRGVLVAANAAVTKDIPDNVLAGGVPARVIRPRRDELYEDMDSST
jgi:maltose O-acetyltransferase